MDEQNKTVATLWNAFVAQQPSYAHLPLPPHFYFCDNEADANTCADLVVKKIKQATAPSMWWYDRNKQSLPKIGDLFDVTDWNGTAKAIIELKKLEVVPFNKVSAAFAFAEGEGEGDKSLAYWRRVHKAYYAREMEAVGAAFVENMLISCEYFKTVFSLVMITPQSPTLPSF